MVYVSALWLGAANGVCFRIVVTYIEAIIQEMQPDLEMSLQGYGWWSIHCVSGVEYTVFATKNRWRWPHCSEK
jgi:hypothetical protein